MATSVAALIKSETGVDPVMIEGAGGVFDVKIDEDLVYSKDETGRFPENDEILGILKQRTE